MVPKPVIPVKEPETTLESPEFKVLLVRVSVEVLVTKVSVISGTVIVLFELVGVQVKVPVTPPD